MKDTPENRKKLRIPVTSNIAWIDLDAQREPPEMVTSGWTDTQIKNKAITQIEDLIRQNELAVEAMEKAIAQQRNQINDLKAVRQRKLLIGDS